MIDANPSFLVKGTSESGVEKYWTGRFEGRWPEYLKARNRALQLAKPQAEATAAQFNAQFDALTWSIEQTQSA